jgi:hypothetical protein
MTGLTPSLGRPAACLLAALALGLAGSANAQDGAKSSPTVTEDPAAPHDFDFQVGAWRVHHRVKRNGAWLEFDGVCVNRPLMAGWGNVEDHIFNRPTGVTRAMGFRAYDPKTRLWAIWWVDGRDPHGPLDPPVKGHFDHGVGTFYSDSVVDGKTIRTRYTWSNITPTSAHWDQADSSDGGKTWETNWTMEFQRIS